jgi:hypothetical protein
MSPAEVTFRDSRPGHDLTLRGVRLIGVELRREPGSTRS